MKTMLALIALIAITATAHAEIFQCAPGVFTDKPCTGGKVVDAKQSTRPANTDAKINFDIKQTTYAVHGADYQSAFAALQRSGKFHAWAKWELDFTYNHSQTEKACTMSNLVIKVSGEIRMPRWAEKQNAARQDQAWWNEGERQLQIHEEGHIQHGKDAAVLLRGKLVSITSESCDTMALMAKTALTTVTTNLNQLDQDYDRLTHHGLRQFNHD